MTTDRDELLARIDEIQGFFRDELLIHSENSRDMNEQKAGEMLESVLRALRAVVELHKSELYVGILYCGGCEDMPIYPCTELQAIAKELG